MNTQTNIPETPSSSKAVAGLEFLIEYISEIEVNSLGGVNPDIKMERVSPDITHVRLQFQLPIPVCQDDWQVSISPAFAPDFHWAPHLTPSDKYVIDQHSFRSPALVVCNQLRSLAVVPDLDCLKAKSPFRYYLDLDAPRNRLTLGMCRTKVAEHVLFTREPGACFPMGTLEFGFYVLGGSGEEAVHNPWRSVLAFLWKRWGRALFVQGKPTNVPPARYVEHTYRWAFEYWKDAVWQEFDWNGQRVGAPAFIVNTTQSPNYPGPANEREFRSIWNQAWFSSLRSAEGLFRYAQLFDDAELMRKALLTKELALSAPQTQGFFPAVIATEMEQVEVDGKLVNRSKGWTTAYWGNSNRNPIYTWGDVRQAPLHILDMSWTVLLMLRWYEELEQDTRLIDYALRYADALLSVQDEQGYFPAWLDPATLSPLEPLQQSPETSMSLTFLLKLYELTGTEGYLSAALRGMEAVCQDIVPVGRWEDFETYWSCCTYGNDSLIGKKITRNNMYKQCNFSIFWTTEALYECYRTTGEKSYLKLGQRCLDELLMTQASWQPPYIAVSTLGGFGVMNCDGEWNDSRQSLFAELIVRYGQILGNPEYVQRGIAALKASFVMMYCPENVLEKEQWEKAWPFFNERDYGFMMENYGHCGQTDDNGLGIGEFTIYDWGNGAAAEAYMRMLAHLGIGFIDELKSSTPTVPSP